LYCTEKEALLNAEFEVDTNMSMRQRRAKSKEEYLGM